MLCFNTAIITMLTPIQYNTEISDSAQHSPSCENLLVAQLANFHFFIHYRVQNSLTLGLTLNQLHPILIFTP